MSADVFVCVVAYNNRRLTVEAVQALERQTEKVRILVWDNASTDDTVAIMQTIPGIEVVASPENILWTPAINRAIAEHWDGEPYIVWLNNDAAPQPSCIERLKRTLEEDETIGLIAPATSMIGGPQDVASIPELHHLLMMKRTDADPDVAALQAFRVSFVLGAFTMLRKSTWDLVGPLDEDMALGADDHDYAIRVKNAGLKIYVNPSALCNHKGHASGEIGESVWAEWNGRSWAAFNRKWAGYYLDAIEGCACHWDGTFTENWVLGTGWLSEEDRAKVWATRN